MKVVALKFGDVLKMADFILENNIQNIETYSRTITLLGFLDEGQIQKACLNYGAARTAPESVKDFN